MGEKDVAKQLRAGGWHQWNKDLEAEKAGCSQRALDGVGGQGWEGELGRSARQSLPWTTWVFSCK